MRPIGFSSGALAKSDFRRGIELQRFNKRLTALELSALRAHELYPLADAVSGLDVRAFRYVSIHAPSELGALSEEEVVSVFLRLPEEWPVVVHPDVIQEPHLWRRLGARICLENMDIRKRIGRTTAEMIEMFAALPEATFCLDIGHARQIDPTMGVAIEMLTVFRERLKQLHVSEVGTFGEHRGIGYLARCAFQKVAKFVATHIPIILESIIQPEQIDRELNLAEEIFAA
jgi:hypothetical protein